MSPRLGRLVLVVIPAFRDPVETLEEHRLQLGRCFAGAVSPAWVRAAAHLFEILDRHEHKTGLAMLGDGDGGAGGGMGDRLQVAQEFDCRELAHGGPPIVNIYDYFAYVASRWQKGPICAITPGCTVDSH